jgi:hypothetical protein
MWPPLVFKASPEAFPKILTVPPRSLSQLELKITLIGWVLDVIEEVANTLMFCEARILSVRAVVDGELTTAPAEISIKPLDSETVAL